MNASDAFVDRVVDRPMAQARGELRSYDGSNPRGHVETSLTELGGPVDQAECDLSLGLGLEGPAALRFIAQGMALNAARITTTPPDYEALAEEEAKRPQPPPAPPRAKQRLQVRVVGNLLWRTVTEVRGCLTGPMRPDDGERLVSKIPDRVAETLRLISADEQLVSVLAHTLVSEATDYVFAEGDPKRPAGEAADAPCFWDMICRAGIALSNVLAREAIPHGGQDAVANDAWIGSGVGDRVAELLSIAFGDRSVAYETAAAYLLLAAVKVGMGTGVPAPSAVLKREADE
ncbi:hypothetical protein GXW71_28240 [Roseomonas hellenica]|uniref:Uncharacterized protein n=1 Tax=Plastoroseomonas hellenica TaxID=2687306 RepID=A0ABS5F6T4_9PROT|nr:hypothetical protein [Plastoroseomonas hellenica]MBR0668275.1 hypothetical protein [Plastoroseomonas hellenica]